MQAAAEPEWNAADFATAATGYIRLLQAHIGKENDILFPMAEQLLDRAQLDALAAAFEKHEATVIGQGRHEQLHAMLKKLKAKHLGE